MSGAQSISARRAYGVHRVCRVWGRARSSVYVRRPATRSRASRRRGPVGAATDEVLVGHIRRVLEASPFHGEGYRKAWAKLRVERIRTSQERVRRLMREHGLQAPYRAGHAHGPKAHDGTITTVAPNVMWGTDMTSTVTVGEGAACVFVAVDHCTAECIGLHAAKRGTRFEALEPIHYIFLASHASQDVLWHLCSSRVVEWIEEIVVVISAWFTTASFSTDSSRIFCRGEAPELVRSVLAVAGTSIGTDVCHQRRLRYRPWFRSSALDASQGSCGVSLRQHRWV